MPCFLTWNLGSQRLEAVAVLLGSVRQDENSDSHCCVETDTYLSFTITLHASTHLIFSMKGALLLLSLTDEETEAKCI